ncbi:collagen-binding domain-containing protein [Companilactobacillus halodurans]|uniref:Choice-of-anchor A family protein n=1 Tax=Companilactobacillus halodurans TaxID=2584183 RepID=A0A5P0ZYU1_9LACO|nr:collagen-binding domain-containing protein [Companilactobacillus halodurans]MQS98221.1 choice-of-anchor A family protein [Companilactobacillus halodurans]
MFMKKGKEWALSCVAVSAAVLMGMSSTTVQADTTQENTVNSNTTNAVSTGTNGTAISNAASTQSSSTYNDANQNNATQNNTKQDGTTQNSLLQTRSAQSATTQSSAAQNGAVTQSVNNDVQDGGNVSDDFSNEDSNQLGYASNFHIFANEATLNAHTNGNIAVGTLNGNVNFGTNIHEGHVEKDISYVQNHNNIASSSFVNKSENRTNKVVFGENNNVDVSNPDRTNVDGTNIDHLTKGETYQDKNGNKYIDFDEYFNFLEGKSNSLSNQDPQVSITNSDFPDQNQRVINLEDYEPNANNQIVINLDRDVLTSGTPLTIAGLSKDSGGTNIIINVDTKCDDPYDVTSQIKLIYNDGTGVDNEERPNKETEFFDDNHLLWNFYNSEASDNLYDGTVIIDRPFQGSVLAPKATVTVNQNLDGNIVADKVNINAETHRWDFQDDSNVETEFEKPVQIPGEVPDQPGEDENDGDNIENPDEEEVEEDIDPDTGDLIEVDSGSEGEDPNAGDEDENDSNENEGTDEDSEDSTGTEDNNSEDNSGSEDSNGDVITNGSSEGTNPDLEAGLLPGVVGNNKDESQTPSSSNSDDETGSLPQTGTTTGILATIVGFIMVAFGLILKATRITKKED